MTTRYVHAHTGQERTVTGTLHYPWIPVDAAKPAEKPAEDHQRAREAARGEVHKRTGKQDDA